MDALLRRRAMIAAGDSPTPPPTPTPTFYTYLYFDGTAYVDTDYILPALCSIGVRCGNETIKAAQRIFRANGNGLVQVNLTSTTTSTRRTFGIYYDSTTVSGNEYLNFSTTAYNFFLTPNGFGWGSTMYKAITKGSAHPDGVLQIGGWGSGQPFSGRMEEFRVYGSDAQNATTASALAAFTPVATFKPCIYNGDAGFWYVEGNKFFGNSAGSGTLTASNS